MWQILSASISETLMKAWALIVWKIAMSLQMNIAYQIKDRETNSMSTWLIYKIGKFSITEDWEI